MIQEGILDRKNILQEKAKYALRTKQSPGKYKSKKDFLGNGGIMYKRSSKNNHQLLVPESLIWEFIKETHNPAFVAHPGVKSTQDLILLRYW